MTTAPPSGRRAGRRTRTLGVVVGGRAGPRSRVWTVTVPRSGPADVVLRPDRPGPSRTVHRAGRSLELPTAVDGPQQELGAAVQSPAPGWHVGAVLVLPIPALCADGSVPVPDGTHHVPGPPPGHHVQIVLLLGDAGCEPLDLPAARDAGSLRLPAGDRVQLWSHHVPSAPRDAGARGRCTGIPVVVDPGHARPT